jgi:hypothetical protein
LTILVAIGFAARAFVAVAWPHVIWPDEHFQVLEPANGWVNSFGGTTWEWSRGMRNWVMPGVYVPLLYALRSVGVVGGPIAIDACRIMAAAASALGIAQFGRLLRLRGLSPAAIVVALLPLLFAPRMLGWGPATFSDTAATSLLWIGMAPAFQALESSRKRPFAAFAVGLWLASLFGVRFPMGFWIAPLGLTAALVYRRRAVIGAMAAGLATGIVLLGLLDLVTLGHFLQSPWQCYQANIVEGIAAHFGVSPWTAYVSSTVDDLGAPVLAIGAALFLSALALRWLRLTRLDALILVPAAVFLAAHARIDHKEGRFILPAYPALLYVGALGASAWLRRWPHAGELATRAARSRAALATASLTLSVWGWWRLPYDGFYSPSGSTDITYAAYRDGLIRSHPGACVVEAGDQPLDLYGRGQMGFGARTDFHVLNAYEVLPERAEWSECVYAMLSPSRLAAFQSAAEGWSWHWLSSGASSAILFVRTLPAPGQACSGWRQTDGCSASGRREPSHDLACNASVPSTASGYCECSVGPRIGIGCGHTELSCGEVCQRGRWPEHP